jgi:beta-glucosidase
VAANPNTAVVVNTGSPVALPWADDVPAILQSWFGGQEMSDAIVDIVTGEADPAGRLGTTFPVRLEHTPAFGNFPGENGEVRYGEGVLMGYRWYEARALPVRFPFGHGLSYTTFAIGAPVQSASVFTRGSTLQLEVEVTNTGARRGSEVVQCYVAPADARLTRAPKELKGFAKVTLDPGESTTVTMVLDDRAFAYWDPGDPARAELAARMSASPLASRVPADVTEPGWRVDPGPYSLHVGRSSADITHTVGVEVAE